jgi:hypothetical protein
MMIAAATTPARNASPTSAHAAYMTTERTTATERFPADRSPRSLEKLTDTVSHNGVQESRERVTGVRARPRECEWENKLTPVK